jgi:hypothetical protein
MYVRRAELSEAMGNLDQALKDLDDAKSNIFQYPPAWARRAWILATAVEPELRDGVRALRAMAIASDKPQSAGNSTTIEMLRIRAAVHAEAGDFDTALRIQDELIEIAITAAVSDSILANFRAQRNLYVGHQPYRETMSGTELIEFRRALEKASEKYQERMRQSQRKPIVQQASDSTESFEFGDLVRRRIADVQVAVAADGTCHCTVASPDPLPANDAESDHRFQSEITALEAKIRHEIDPDGDEQLADVFAVNSRTGTFVVRQTGSTQTEIRRLLEQARESASLQAKLRIDLLTVPPKALEETLGMEEALFAIFQQTTFVSADQARAARQIPEKSPRAAILPNVACRLYNGQSANLKLRRRLADQSTVELPGLKLKVSLADQEMTLLLEGTRASLGKEVFRRRFNLQSGESVITDITDVVQPPANIVAEQETAPAEDRVVLLISVERRPVNDPEESP